MRSLIIMASAGLAATLVGCTSIPTSMTVADYCANPDKATENVCRLKVEIDGNSTALSETNMSLSKARAMAESAVSAAADAKSRADSALAAANRAQSTADRAMATALQDEDLTCVTNTVQKTNIGTCSPGYTVMGCVQTRYTTRAGGLSFLREINDQQCRFNSRVLEMQVRCCKASATTTTASYAGN